MKWFAAGPIQVRTLALADRHVDAARELLTQLVENSPRTPDGSAGELMPSAKAVVRLRKKRSAFFPAAMFGEPAWDILLAIYTWDQVREPTVTSLANVIGTPQSSAIRWLDYLEAQRFVFRESHPTDRRSSIAQLTDMGRAGLEAYLRETIAGDSLACRGG